MKRSSPISKGRATCAACGKALVRRGRKYCSQRCMGDAMRKPRACTVCGIEFFVGNSPHRKTCSPQCAGEAKARAKRGRPMPKDAILKTHTALARQRVEREGGLIPPAPKKCKRPGCSNSLTGQARIYCSPGCHYRDRGRVVSPGGHRRVDFKDDSTTCRACEAPAAHNHHVVYRQHVERAKGDRWHPDDALALCVQCHGVAHAHRLPVSVLRDENLRFAGELFGAYGVDYLRRYYVDDGDPRLAAMDQVAA